MTNALPIDFCGHNLLADVSGALYWAATATLIVSDLHFEKASAFAQHQQRPLPPYDTRETLSVLHAAVDRYRPDRVLCLGDSFHDRHAHDRMAPEDRNLLGQLVNRADWIWITGNHDPLLDDALCGDIREDFTQHGLTFRHQALAQASGELSGHFHPKAAITVDGRRISGKCFAFDDARLIMPAFGAFTGGLSVLDPAISGLLRNDFSVAMIGRQRVARLPRSRLAVY